MNPYKTLLQKSIAAIVLCSILVLIAYYFIDQPVAFMANRMHLEQYEVFDWFTYLPAWISALAIPVIVFLAIKLAWSKLKRWQQMLLTISVTILVTSAIKNLLKVVFGRYWLATWVNNNPSLLKDNVYGFHFFHAGSAYTSFPSGHATVIFAAMTILWLTYPKWRWLSMLCCFLVVSGLIAMQYHFVGDIIAGGFLGGITGAYGTRWFQLNKGRTHRIGLIE